MRFLGGLCMLVLGLLIGVTGDSPSAVSGSPTTLLTAYLGALWLFASGLHKVLMVIGGDSFAPLGGLAIALWFALFGIVLAGGNFDGAKLTWPQTIITFLFFFGWPVVDAIGVHNDS